MNWMFYAQFLPYAAMFLVVVAVFLYYKKGWAAYNGRRLCAWAAGVGLVQGRCFVCGGHLIVDDYHDYVCCTNSGCRFNDT